jgi:hypothetical protein
VPLFVRILPKNITGPGSKVELAYAQVGPRSMWMDYGELFAPWLLATTCLITYMKYGVFSIICVGFSTLRRAGGGTIYLTLKE